MMDIVVGVAFNVLHRFIKVCGSCSSIRWKAAKKGKVYVSKITRHIGTSCVHIICLHSMC